MRNLKNHRKIQILNLKISSFWQTKKVLQIGPVLTMHQSQILAGLGISWKSYFLVDFRVCLKRFQNYQKLLQSRFSTFFGHFRVFSKKFENNQKISKIQIFRRFSVFFKTLKKPKIPKTLKFFIFWAYLGLLWFSSFEIEGRFW